MATLTQVLADVLALRGVLAAAVVSVDGEVLSGAAADTALLDRMTGAVTGALAAGEALSGLVARSLTSTSPAEAWADKGESGDPEAAAQVAASVEDDEAAGSPGAAGNPARPGSKQLMVIYEDSGPIVFTPLPGGERVAVVALTSAHDLGRARFQLRGFTQALAMADVPLG